MKTPSQPVVSPAVRVPCSQSGQNPGVERSDAKRGRDATAPANSIQAAMTHGTRREAAAAAAAHRNFFGCRTTMAGSCLEPARDDSMPLNSKTVLCVAAPGQESLALGGATCYYFDSSCPEPLGPRRQKTAYTIPVQLGVQLDIASKARRGHTPHGTTPAAYATHIGGRRETWRPRARSLDSSPSVTDLRLGTVIL